MDVFGSVRRVLVFTPMKKTFARDQSMIDHFAERGITVNPMPTPELDSAQKLFLRDLNKQLWDNISWPSDTPVKRKISFSQSKFANVSSPVDAARIENNVVMKCEYCGDESESSDESVCNLCGLPLIECRQ